MTTAQSSVAFSGSQGLALVAGARRKKACEILGLTVRVRTIVMRGHLVWRARRER